jgi:hypothetical protein
MHWYTLALGSGIGRVGDWGYLGSKKIDTDGIPYDGYGPYHAQLLQRLNGNPTTNADNFAWMAIKAYFEYPCGHVFTDATTNGVNPWDRDDNSPQDFVADPPAE